MRVPLAAVVAGLRLIVVVVVLFSSSSSSSSSREGVAGLEATPVPPTSAAPIDKTCFELPIVVVTPLVDRLPTETCTQQRFPAIDCMKTPVEVHLEVVDNADGSLNCLNGSRTAVLAATAHYRGQSSLHFAKHQVSVKLHETRGFLGFLPDTRFVLNGPTIDSSLLRNHLAHWLFRATTRYSPRTRHAVVFVRDRLASLEPAYKGIYLALEKIAYGPHRVGLAPLHSGCRGAELSGGWAWQNNPLNYGVYSPNIVRDQYQALLGSGERPVLTFPPGEKLTQRMRDYFVDPRTGPLPALYRTLYENLTDPDALDSVMDMGSFVDYFLHSELSQNTDAYRRSTYFFRDRGQPINAGPVWDFNLAYGKGANQLDWLYKPHAFWRRLTCSYKFASLVQRRWRELRGGVWSDAAITAFLGDAAAPIARQLERCTGAWTSNQLQCANVNGDGTFAAYVDSLGRTVLARARWMDERVAGFFMRLNASVCEPAGPIPQFNCAADGDDGGCLRDPEKYIAAVEFPPIRQASTASASCARAAVEAGASTNAGANSVGGAGVGANTAGANTATVGGGARASGNGAAGASGTPVTPMNGTSDDDVQEPTIDPCWLSAGVYMTDGSLTPFCSGYGWCPPGPGVTCQCISGRKLPTCARSDDPIGVGSFLQRGDGALQFDRVVLLLVVAVVGTVGMAIGGLAMVLRRRRERRRQYPPIANRRTESSSLQYGT